MNAVRSLITRLLNGFALEPDGRAQVGPWRFDPQADTEWSDTVDWLADRIYASEHCAMSNASLVRGHVHDAGAIRAFVRALSRANTTQQSWEAGWTFVRPAESGLLTVQRHGVQCDVPHEEVQWTGAPVAGTPCRVRVAGEQLHALPGFYLALGAQTPPLPPHDQLRVYWNVRSPGAPALLASLGARLNAAAIPYWLKLHADPAGYGRSDAAVLYLQRESTPDAASLVMDAMVDVVSWMREETSPFALTLAPGLAVSVDLEHSASFGQHRSRALAHAILTVVSRGVDGAQANDAVLAELRDAGVDPEAPWRHAGDDGATWSRWMAQARPATARTTPVEPPRPAAIDPERALAAASLIAEWLCEEAVVHGGRWNWMGSDAAVDDEDGALVIRYGSLGPSVYDGTAGIGLFLAEAAAATGNSAFVDGARGALRHALAHAGDMPADVRSGFHTGNAGLAWVLARAGVVLDDRELRQQARGLAVSLVPDESVAAVPLLDVISGAAGTAVAMLSLADDLELDMLRDGARRLGRVLGERATRGDNGWSWGAEASGVEYPRALTGFAHGAGGIGWALLELGTRLGEPDFVHGAVEAFRYEDQWFDPREDNWPDFRETDGVSEPAPCMTAWCHGAPGILLSRTRWLQLTGHADARRDLERGLRTTLRWLGDPDVIASASYTLCHGQLGAAACALAAAEALGDAEGRVAALATAARGLAAHGHDPSAWASGVRRGPHPSLMLGQAGIGHFYLRLASSATPSVLRWSPR